MSFAEPTDGGRIILEAYGPNPVALKGTVQPGDPIAYSSGDAGFVRADGSTDALRPQFIAGMSGVSGNTIIAYDHAIIDFGSTCTATVGADLYLSATAGDYSASAAGYVAVIGRMMTAQIAHCWALHS